MRSRRPRHVRITEPLVRDSGGCAPRAGTRRSTGRPPGSRVSPREAFGMFSCSKATNEMNFAAQKFARAVMGSNNVDSCNRT